MTNPEIYVTIIVEGKDKKAQRAVIDKLDGIIAKHEYMLEEIKNAIQFKNVRTRERKPSKPKLSPLETVELDSNGEEEAPSGDK